MGESDLIKTLTEYKAKVEKEIEKFFDGKKASATEFGGFTNEAYEILKDYTLRGGKRFRATMCIMTYRGISNDLSDAKIVKPASSLEFMQSSLLTHDDIMDENKIRRNRMTPHVWIAEWYKKNITNDVTKADKFGRNMAIILGDMFNAYGIECIVRSEFAMDRRNAALDIYNTMYETTGKGQILDIWFGEKKDTTEQDYIDMIDRKTVHYTVEKPAILGATLAGATQEQKELLSKFAFPLGRGFQIQDDILDCLSTQEKLGKAIGTDIKEGKNTIIALYAKKHATPEQLETINSVMGNAKATHEQIMSVVELFKQTGAIDYAKERAKTYVLEGKKYLDELKATGISEETMKFYADFADYLVERKY